MRAARKLACCVGGGSRGSSSSYSFLILFVIIILVTSVVNFAVATTCMTRGEMYFMLRVHGAFHSRCLSSTHLSSLSFTNLRSSCTRVARVIPD